MKFLLVGSFATKGAAAVIAKGLRQGAEVTLVPEPENPYDANAVRVFVARSVLRGSDDLAEALADSGLTEATLWAEPGVRGDAGDAGDPLFPLGHLGAKYETKTAKAALREGHQFRLARDFPAGGEGSEARKGALVQYPDGTKLIEVKE